MEQKKMIWGEQQDNCTFEQRLESMYVCCFLRTSSSHWLCR
jgi:hypothetical protein